MQPYTFNKSIFNIKIMLHVFLIFKFFFPHTNKMWPNFTFRRWIILSTGKGGYYSSPQPTFRIRGAFSTFEVATCNFQLLMAQIINCNYGSNVFFLFISGINQLIKSVLSKQKKTNQKRLLNCL